jgi:hypothetical protein
MKRPARVVKECVAHVRAAQVRAAQIRAAQVRAAQVRVAQVRAAQVRAAQVRVVQVRAVQVRAAQIRDAQVRAVQIRAAQVCAAQVRATQVRVSQVRSLAIILIRQPRLVVGEHLLYIYIHFSQPFLAAPHQSTKRTNRPSFALRKSLMYGDRAATSPSAAKRSGCVIVTLRASARFRALIRFVIMALRRDASRNAGVLRLQFFACSEYVAQRQLSGI